MAIYQKLFNIQKRVKGLGKDTTGYGYQYVSGNKVLGEIRKHMDEEGVLLKTEIIRCTNTPQEYTNKKGHTVKEVFTELELKFTWIDIEDGSKDECVFFANGMNDWEKGLGSALTYGERYFLLKYFHIQTDCDDIDNPERKAEEPSPKEEVKEGSLPEKGIGEEKAQRFRASLIKNFGSDKARELIFKIHNKFNLKDLRDLSGRNLQKLIDVKYEVEKIQTQEVYQ